MSNSSLVTYTKISPNSSPRTAKIDTITIHHMAGCGTVEACGEIFAKASRGASSNYGADNKGHVGLYVDESRRAWTSSNRENDNRAITIEVANDSGAPDWHVSDKALETTIDLCVDICQRNGITKLNYTGDKTGNLTMHKWFASTNCPGPYLESKFPYIADAVNKRLGVAPESKPTPEVAPAATPKAQSCTGELPILRNGARGESVKALQVLLEHHGCACGKAGVDGIFGSGTEKAVKEYQKKNGLTSDGIVGAKTWAKLLEV